jgi:hypothetical protein
MKNKIYGAEFTQLPEDIRFSTIISIDVFAVTYLVLSVKRILLDIH